MILVTGATGNAGREVACILVSVGQQVHGLIRRADQQAALPQGVEGVIGDLNRPGTLSAALVGVRRPTGEIHHYLFLLYATNIAQIGGPGLTFGDVINAPGGHVLGATSIMGIFHLP